ncbi:MAG: ATP-binding protein [Lentimicrobiaceae bacterium]|nr:ATP-binding protein [Lentimicrobiaceae bacterium]
MLIVSFYTIFLAIAFGLSLLVATLVFNKKYIPGRLLFFFLMLFVAEYALAASIESAVSTIEKKILWSQIEYIGNMGIGVFFMYFILYFTGEKSITKNKKWLLLWIIPILMVVFAFTNDYHHLVWSNFTWSYAKENILIYHHGPLFWIGIPYSLLLVCVGIFILLQSVYRFPMHYRKQVWFLFIASVFPFVTTILYITGLNPVEGLDISPIGFTFTGIIFFLGISKKRLFDLSPIARHVLFEKMQDSLIVLDTFQRIIDFNPAAKKQLGIDNQDLGKYYPEVFPALWTEIKDKDITTEYRIELYLKQFNQNWFEITFSPLMDERHNLHGSLIVFHDVTKRKNYEKLLNQLNLKLSESEINLKKINSQKDQFFSIIAHDLKSPFTTIIGLSEVLTEGFDDYDENEKIYYLNSIKEAGNNTLKLLENLLQWAQSQTGLLSFLPEKTDLYSLVYEIIEISKLQAVQKNIILTTTILPQTFVTADKNMLQTILRNLVSNAIKFSYSDGNVKIHYAKTPTEHQISVTDQGTGIKPEDIAKLFIVGEKFKTLGTKDERGTGLGLLLCKEFVEKHHGKIWVNSEVGIGSTFLFTIPVN